MLTHRGFSAWIISEGGTIPEYLVAVDEPTHRVSCWIPATVGESFSIFWQDHNGGVDTSSFITLDGVTVPGRFLFGDGMASRSGVRVSKTTERPFVFAPIGDEGDSGSSAAVNKEIGMITLKIKRVKRVTIRPANPIQELPSVTALGKRKAGDVRVDFGLDEQPLEEQASTTWGTVPYDEVVSGQSSSYVSFMFRYRTREFLEAQGIITESASSRPLPTTGCRQPKMPDGQQRDSFNNPPPAKLAAEFTPEPETEPSATASKKPRLGASSSRPTHPALNNLRSRPTELRRIASSSSSSSTPVAAFNPYGIFYYQRSISSPTHSLGHVGPPSGNQSGHDAEESNPNTGESGRQ